MNPLAGFFGSAVVVLLVIALVAGMFCFAVVPPGHRGVSVTLGRVSPQVVNEGFTLKKPFIESIVPISIKQTTVTRDTQCFSADLQTIKIAYSVMYRIPENQVVTLYREYQGDPYDSLIAPRVQESLKQITAMYQADTLVKQRGEIREAAIAKTRESVGDVVQIVDINIVNIDLSDLLEKAIESKMVREQESQAKQYELTKAQKQAEITKIEAQAEAEAVRIKGQALSQHPDMIQLEIIRKWDGRTPHTVVTSAGGASILLPTSNAATAGADSKSTAHH